MGFPVSFIYTNSVLSAARVYGERERAHVSSNGTGSVCMYGWERKSTYMYMDGMVPCSSFFTDSVCACMLLECMERVWMEREGIYMGGMVPSKLHLYW